MQGNAGMNDKAVVRGVELRLEAARVGVSQAFPPVPQVVVAGKSYTQADLQARIDQELKPWKDAREAHATLRQFTKDKPQLTKAAEEFLAGVEAAAVAQFGRASETLTQYGFKPLKPRRQLTVEEKIQRVAKAKLTRQKRGTLGKKQRAAIKAEGTPAVSVTPDGEMHVSSDDGSSATPPPPPPPPANGRTA